MMKMFLPSLIIPPILLGITYMLGSRSLSDRDKLSPFECGFDPMKSARQPFSMRFFLLAVLFLVFDIELVLLLPTIVTQTYSNLLFAFLCILLLGLLHEWNEGSLDWKS